MIVDSLNNAAKYYGLHPAFEKAFQFLKENDLANLADGVTQYTDDLKLIRSRSRTTSSRVATLCTRPALSRGPIFFQRSGLTV